MPLSNEIRQAVWSVNGDVPIALERTMQDLYAGSLARTSFALVMLALAGSMALALSIIGIYGVIAYVVSQRRREIGIRIALGAQPRQVRMMFLQHGLALSVVGLAIGLVAALALTRLLFEIEPTDVARMSWRSASFSPQRRSQATCRRGARRPSILLEALNAEYP